MAAPSSAYTGFSLFTGDCEHGQAILAPDYSTFKTRFYLDEVIGGKEGVVGCVTIGGLNASYHNLTTRGGKGRFGNLQVLNDGGLNTKGDTTITSTSSDLENGGLNITLNYKSAYYVDTDFYLRARIISGGSWTNYFIKSLSMNQTSTDTNLKVDIDYSLPLVAGDLLEVQAYSSNAEGDSPATTSQFVTIKAWLKQMKYGTTAELAYERTTTEDVYINTKILDIGSILYSNENPGAVPPAGFYMNVEDNFYFEIDSSGIVINKNEYTPSSPLNYVPSAQRISSDSDFGTYEFKLIIYNDYIAGQLAGDVLFKMGQLADTGEPIIDSNLITRDSYTFPGLVVASMSNSNRETSRVLSEPVSTYTWAWIALKGGEQIGEGYFPL